MGVVGRTRQDLPAEVVVHPGREAVLEEPGHNLPGAEVYRTHLAVVVAAARLGIHRVRLEEVRRIVPGVVHHTGLVGGHHTVLEERHQMVGSSSHPWCHKTSRSHPGSF